MYTQEKVSVLSLDHFLRSIACLPIAGARRNDVGYSHVAKVGIVGIVEPIVSDESLKIVDVGLPAL
jgi:hypothetical protein